MSSHSPDSVALCDAAASRAIARYGWQLISQQELVRRAILNLDTQRSPDPQRAIFGTYCEVLYAACAGHEGSARQNRAYQELGAYLYGVVRDRYSTLAPELHEDVVQDALLRVHQSIGRCQHPIAFLSFAAYHLLDAVRFMQRRQAHNDVSLSRAVNEDESFYDILPDQRPTPEEQAVAGAQRRGIEQLLADYVCRHTRAEKQITVLRKTYIEGLDDSMIGSQLHMSVSAVQTARSRIKESLRSDQQWRERARELGLLDD